MTLDQGLSLNNSDSFFLKQEVAKFELEVKSIQAQLDRFEAELRLNLIDEIIEEQELTVLYKKIKQAKKAKRLEQKKRGKNYKEPKGLLPIPQRKSQPNKDDQKEKKRLYREALLHVHPDKFSLDTVKMDVATDISTKLIEIYQSGDLLELQEYHAHIFSGNSLDLKDVPKSNIYENAYLKKQIIKLKQQIQDLKSKHTYKVLTEYENPLNFINELKAYYNDRLMKLRKRTRTNKASN